MCSEDAVQDAVFRIDLNYLLRHVPQKNGVSNQTNSPEEHDQSRDENKSASDSTTEVVFHEICLSELLVVWDDYSPSSFSVAMLFSISKCLEYT